MNRKYFFDEKKASAGTTVTWSVAFFVVIFLMIVFFIVSGFLIGERKVVEKIPFSGFSGSNINILLTGGNLDSQMLLFSILSHPIGEGNKIEDLVIFWKLKNDLSYRNRIENEISKIFIDGENCFIFRVDGEDVFKNSKLKKDFSFANKTIYLSDKEINLEVYSKKC